MDKQTQINILMVDYCTEKEALKHLKEGTTIHTSFEDYAGMYPTDTDIEEMQEGFKALTQVVYNGVTYYIDYVV